MAAHPIRLSEVPRFEPVRAERGPFATFGEQLQAVVRAGSGRDPDPRLYEVRAAAGASEQVPSDGGFLVQPEFSRQLVQRMYLTGEIYRRCLELPITTAGIKFPKINETSRVAGSRLGGVQVFTEAEAATAVPTKPAFELSELVPKKIIGVLYLTDELQMDTDALATWATYAFALEMMYTIENLIVNGTGAGQIQGILNSPALISAAKETGQGSATIVNQNVIHMVSRLWAASRKNAIWLYHQDALAQLLQLTTVVGSAGSQSNLWQFQLTDGDSDRLAGIPAFPSEYCQAPGTPGDVILADFSRYVVAMRERRTEMSVHLRFTSDENAIRFVIRCQGMPIDSAPVTPANASNTTSPFVALAAR